LACYKPAVKLAEPRCMACCGVLVGNPACVGRESRVLVVSSAVGAHWAVNASRQNIFQRVMSFLSECKLIR